MSTRQLGDYRHLAQRGERVRVLYTDGTWDLVDDRNRTKGNMPFWLVHRCPDAKVGVQRYHDIIHLPCVYCGDVCPVPLEGLYNMMRYL
jgi:hypothetical protein